MKPVKEDVVLLELMGNGKHKEAAYQASVPWLRGEYGRDLDVSLVSNITHALLYEYSDSHSEELLFGTYWDACDKGRDAFPFGDATLYGK